MGDGGTNVGVLSDTEAWRELSRSRSDDRGGEILRHPAAFSPVWWQQWGLSAMLVFLVLALLSERRSVPYWDSSLSISSSPWCWRRE